MTELSAAQSARAPRFGAHAFGAALPFLALLVIGLALPLFAGGYWGVIAQRACVYWTLVAGLNLLVGFAGQLAIGWVALLTLGAYTTSVLAAGNVMPAFHPYLALAIAGAVGAVFGVIVGLPALRLRTFYFAITTLGFATIVTQIALAWQSVTGGGVGVPGPIFPPPFDSQWGFYYFCFGIAAICTWMTMNVAASRFGRALTAIRDADVAAEACGVSKAALLVAVFLFSGAVAAVAGGLFASLQSYITPDAFTIDLSVLFFQELDLEPGLCIDDASAFTGRQVNEITRIRSTPCRTGAPGRGVPAPRAARRSATPRSPASASCAARPSRPAGTASRASSACAGPGPSWRSPPSGPRPTRGPPVTARSSASSSASTASR